jgi:DNA-binding XRE family transcriptional regulator
MLRLTTKVTILLDSVIDYCRSYRYGGSHMHRQKQKPSASLGDRLRLAREMAGIPARELDRLAGLSEGHTANIESGRRPNIEARTASAIATVLGLSLDWLVSDAGSPPSEAAIRDSVARSTLAAPRASAGS